MITSRHYLTTDWMEKGGSTYNGTGCEKRNIRTKKNESNSEYKEAERYAIENFKQEVPTDRIQKSNQIQQGQDQHGHGHGQNDIGRGDHFVLYVDKPQEVWCLCGAGAGDLAHLSIDV